MVSLSKDSYEKEVVLLKKTGKIATVTLNRPEKLNALTQKMWKRVGSIFLELNDDEDIQCIILRGAGDRAFGPGADISEFNKIRNNSRQASRYGELMHEAMGSIRNCRHPIVACIRGLCVGGALELALVCDIRVAGDTARFGVPVNRLGLVMAYPEIVALVNLVGSAVALEIVLEGRVFGALEAKEKGLINKIVPDKNLEEAINEMVENICAGAPLVNRWHKKFVHRIMNSVGTKKPLTKDELAEGFLCFDTEDYQEGLKAFLNKKTPTFKGK